MEDDTDVDPWICRRCGKGLDEHDHSLRAADSVAALI